MSKSALAEEFGLGKRKKKGNPVSLKQIIPNVADFEVWDEFQALIPPLQPEEREQLKANILKEGVRDPLVVWEEENILIDGHNRWSIIQENDILDYSIKKLSFPNKEAAKDWMIDLQLGRRNLTKEQASYLRGLQHEREKAKKDDNLKNVGDFSKPQNEASEKTAEKLAKQHNVSRATIERDAQYAKGLEKIGEKNPKLKREILAGEVKAKKGDIQKLAKIEEPVTIEKPEDIQEAVKVSIKPECPEQMDIGEPYEVVENNEILELELKAILRIEQSLNAIKKALKNGKIDSLSMAPVINLEEQSEILCEAIKKRKGFK